MKRLLILVILMLFIASCATMGKKEQQGTVGGAVVGGVIGAIIGHNAGGNTAAGAAIGAAIGGTVGNRMGAYMDQQEAALKNTLASAQAANQVSIQRSNEVLMATFKGDLFFDHNSAIVKPGGYAELDRVATVLNSYPNTSIRIEGHTSLVGSENYNQILSESRAGSVRRILIQKGVDPKRMTAIGFGKSMPISSDPATNRRVTIVITPNA